MNQDLWTDEIPEEVGFYWFYGDLFLGSMGVHYTENFQIKPKMEFVEIHQTANSLLGVSNGQLIPLRKFDKQNRIQGVAGYWMKAIIPATPSDTLGLF